MLFLFSFFFFRIHAKRIIPTLKKKLDFFQNHSPPPKETTTDICSTPPPFLFLPSFPPKQKQSAGLGLVGRSSDGRVASRVDAFPRSLRSSALDLSVTRNPPREVVSLVSKGFFTLFQHKTKWSWYNLRPEYSLEVDLSAIFWPGFSVKIVVLYK